MRWNNSCIPLIHCCWGELCEVTACTARSLLVSYVCRLAIGRAVMGRSRSEQAEVRLGADHGIRRCRGNLDLSCWCGGDGLVETVVVFQVEKERTGWRASPVFIWNGREVDGEGIISYESVYTEAQALLIRFKKHRQVHLHNKSWQQAKWWWPGRTRSNGLTLKDGPHKSLTSRSNKRYARLLDVGRSLTA